MATSALVTRCLLLLTGTLAPVAARAADGIHWTITGQTSVTFDWRGSEADRVIRLGTSRGVYTDSVTAVKPLPVPDSSPGPYWEARLTGLRENTLYRYRIGRGPEHTFRTPPPRGTSGFWIAEQADVGSTLSYRAVGPTQASIASDLPAITGDDRPRFVLVPGDLTYGDDRSAADVDRHFNDVMVWSQDAAYMPAWGNHEWDTHEGGDDLNDYEGRFDFPNSRTAPGADAAVGNGPGEDWYWFDYGNARFIALPEPYAGAREDWFVRADSIMTAAQADPALAFIVTFGHRPAWSSGADQHGNEKLAGMLASLKARHTKYVLDLSGHSHHYSRSRPELTGGLTHVIGSGGGAKLGGLSPTKPDWCAYRIDHLVHVRMRFERDRIEGYAVCGPDGAGARDRCRPGSIVDRWTIPAPSAQGSPAAPPGTGAKR